MHYVWSVVVELDMEITSYFYLLIKYFCLKVCAMPYRALMVN